jgi:hypothetical protein
MILQIEIIDFFSSIDCNFKAVGNLKVFGEWIMRVVVDTGMKERKLRHL